MQRRPIGERHFDLWLAAGFILKTKIAGWRLFCERLSFAPFTFWELLPGYQRYLRLDSREALIKGGNTGSTAVVPGKSAPSTRFDFVSGRVQGMEMPPLRKRNKFAAFTNEELDLFCAWIERGAVWPKDVVLNAKWK